MPEKLTTQPIEKIRQFIISEARPSEMSGYDPTQTDSQQTDFLPVTKDYSRRGDYYPIILCTQAGGPVIPNSGETNYNGIQGDGSGPNQQANHQVQVAVITSQDGAYLSGVDYYTLAHNIYSEIKYQIQGETKGDSETLFQGGLTPPTETRSNTEGNGGSTSTWYQLSGTVPVGVLYTP